MRWILNRISEKEKEKEFDNSEIELLINPILKYKGSQSDLESSFNDYLNLNSNLLLLKTIIDKSSSEYCEQIIEKIIGN